MSLGSSISSLNNNLGNAVKSLNPFMKKKPKKEEPKTPVVSPPDFTWNQTGELNKTPEQTAAYNNPNKVMPGELPPGTPTYQNPNDQTASYRADFNPDHTVDYTIGGKNYHLTRHEYDMLSPSSAGIITQNVTEIQDMKKNLRLYGQAMAPEQATKENLNAEINKIQGADANKKPITTPTSPGEAFKQGFSDTFQKGNVNANIISGFAQTVDAIKSLGTLKPSKTVTQAIDTFSNAKQSVSSQIDMVKNGQMSYLEAAQSLRTMKDAVSQLEQASAFNAQGNLNYWLDQGLNLDTQLISEKDDMEKLENELIRTYNSRNAALEAGYAKQYGGY